MRVKGSALRARLLWAERHSADGPARLLAALAPETRAVIAGNVLANQWYPFAAFVDLNVSLDKVFGSGDLALCRELGRWSCDVNLTLLYKMLFKIGSVSFIIRRAALAWSTHYDEGRMQVVDEDAQYVQLRWSGIAEPHRAHCLSVCGWIVRACELSGGKVGETHERCRLLDAPECELEVRWR